jgi:hypothetical protein
LSGSDGKKDFVRWFRRSVTDDIDANQLAIAHRQSGMMLIFTLVLIGFLSFIAIGTFGGNALMIIVLFPLPTLFLVYVVRGYFNRDSWALPWVSTIWTVAIGICFIYSLIEFSAASMGGDTWGYIQGFLLLYLCWSMLQRLRMVRHPLFQAWYDGGSMALNQNIALLDDEVLASCPHCQSLLAVQPLSLKHDEKCPKCNLPLVLPESVQLYLEEE